MIFVYILIVIVALAAAFIIRGSLLKTTEYKAEYHNLPESFDGFRIVVLSDLHDRRFVGGYRRFAKRVKKMNPDLILISGDLHNAGCPRLDYVDFLKNLSPIAPCYYVTGNHDPNVERPEEYEAYLNRIADAGVTIPERHRIKRGNNYITLIGTNWLRSLTVMPTGFTIRLAHNPAVFEEAHRADLTVCGHIHGGFIRLPKFGPVFAPGEGAGLFGRFSKDYFKPKYSKGIYTRGDKKLYVNEGLGFTAFPPFRLIRGEIGTIILKKISKNS